MLLFHELFPLWSAFFEALGMEVVVSEPLSKKVMKKDYLKWLQIPVSQLEIFMAVL